MDVDKWHHETMSSFFSVYYDVRQHPHHNTPITTHTPPPRLTPQHHDTHTLVMAQEALLPVYSKLASYYKWGDHSDEPLCDPNAHASLRGHTLLEN